MTREEKLAICAQGCTDDFYNRRPHTGCWSLETAEMATRYTIGHWTPMDTAKNLNEVQTLSCFHEAGPNRTHYLKAVPEHLRAEWNELKAKGEK
jgi:hypothetical protein